MKFKPPKIVVNIGQHIKEHQNKYELLVFIIILAISIFLHFFMINTNYYYSEDPALQSQVIKQMWTTHTPVIDGPATSLEAGKSFGFTHGAFYYYLFLIPGIVFHFNPLVFGIIVALLSTASGVLLYFSIKPIFPKAVTYISFLIFAASFNVNFYGRILINPDNIPFFTALSLFSLVQFLKGQRYFLILFFFSISAITQLHITGYIFIFVGIVLLPFLWKKCTNILIWGLSLTAFLIPWLPTFVQQYKYHFPIIKFIITVITTTHSVGILGHYLDGYNRITDIFQQIIQLGGFFPIVIIIGSISILVGMYIQAKEDETLRIVIIFICSVLLFTFLMFAFYPGNVFIDYGEQLFIIYPLLTAIFINIFLRYKETTIISAILIYVIVETNLFLYKQTIYHGPKYYLYENKICQIVKAGDNRNYILNVTGTFAQQDIYQTVINPMYLIYICDTVYNFPQNAKQSKKITYFINTDYKTYLNFKAT